MLKLDIIDRIYLKRAGYGNPDSDGSVRKSIVTTGDPKSLWILFLPAGAYDREDLHERSIPKNSFSVTYRIPQDVITTNPVEIRWELDLLYGDAKDFVKSSKIPLDNIRVHGTSLGATLATKLASEQKLA